MGTFSDIRTDGAISSPAPNAILRADSDAFRGVMRHVVTGVNVIATLEDGRPWGMTVSAFAPVCMDPPMLVICVNLATRTAEHIARDRRFSVNLLSEYQSDVSHFCASPGQSKYIDDHVVDAEMLDGDIAMPVILNSLATFDCEVEHAMPVGTHLVTIGSILSIVSFDQSRPLLYGSGGYRRSVALGDIAGEAA